MTNKRDARQALMILRGWEPVRVESAAGDTYIGAMRSIDHILVAKDNALGWGAFVLFGSDTITTVPWDVLPNRFLRSLYHRVTKHDQDPFA